MNKVLLSFDIEEFDMPMEFGYEIPLERQLEISQLGTKRILDILKKYQVKATFYSTVVFAENSRDLIKRLLDEGHELASHTVTHGEFKKGDGYKSKIELEKIGKCEVKGFRMPRMQPIATEELITYEYNSSINPTYIPGRYNHLNHSRTYEKTKDFWILPSSVTPMFRIPLFWISFHNFPLWFYKHLLGRTITSDGYVNLYFHPWEFTDLSEFPFPSYLKRNCDVKMVDRFDNLCAWAKEKGLMFSTTGAFISSL